MLFFFSWDHHHKAKHRFTATIEGNRFQAARLRLAWNSFTSFRAFDPQFCSCWFNKWKDTQKNPPTHLKKNGVLRGMSFLCKGRKLSRPGFPDRSCGLERTVYHSLASSQTIWIWTLPTAFWNSPGLSWGILCQASLHWNELRGVMGGFGVLSLPLTLLWPLLSGSQLLQFPLHSRLAGGDRNYEGGIGGQGRTTPKSI